MQKLVQELALPKQLTEVKKRQRQVKKKQGQVVETKLMQLVVQKQ